MSNKYQFLLVLLMILFLVNNNHAFAANDAGSISEYRGFLSELDKFQVVSIDIAKEMYWSLFPVGSSNAEEGFRLFKNFHTQSIRILDRKFYTRKDIQGMLREHPIFQKTLELQVLPPLEYLSEDLKESVQTKFPGALTNLYEYSKCGVIYYMSEGDWYMAPDYNFYLEDVLNKYNLNIKHYLHFINTENKTRVAHDGGLIISWEDLRLKIMRFEKFVEKYPKLPETKSDIIPKLDKFIDIYLFGLDNTPIKYNSKGVLQSWKNFLTEQPNSRYQSRVEIRYNEIKSLEPKVDDDFTALANTIHKAKPGDIIEVPPGRYNVDSKRGLVIQNKKNLTLKSQDGKVELYSEKPDIDIIRILGSTDIVIDGFILFHTVETNCAASCIVIKNSKNIVIQKNDRVIFKSCV